MLPVNFNLTIAPSDVDTFIQLLNEGGFKAQWDSFNEPLFEKVSTEELQEQKINSYDFLKFRVGERLKEIEKDY